MEENYKALAGKERFQGRDFLTLYDYSPAELALLLDLASRLKEMQRKGTPHRFLEGKSLGMIFQKSSTRTRVSFEVGMFQLGGQALFLSSSDLQLGRGESIADTARVLSRYLDGIMIRTYAHADVEELARHASVPVINGLTDLLHPCQVLADLLTIKELKGSLAGLKLAFIGDGNNMAHSFLLGGARTGLQVAVAAPAGYEPDAAVVARARTAAAETGGSVFLTRDPAEAAAGADVLVTDVWASMGQEAEQEKRRRDFAGYCVDARLASLARPDYLFLHCLPAHRGEEVAAEVIDGPHAAVWQEAENRLHAQKAILAMLL